MAKYSVVNFKSNGGDKIATPQTIRNKIKGVAQMLKDKIKQDMREYMMITNQEVECIYLGKWSIIQEYITNLLGIHETNHLYYSMLNNGFDWFSGNTIEQVYRLYHQLNPQEQNDQDLLLIYDETFQQYTLIKEGSFDIQSLIKPI